MAKKRGTRVWWGGKGPKSPTFPLSAVTGTGVLELNPPPLDPDQPNFSIWAGGVLIHISNSPKLARGGFISYRSVLDLFLTVFPLENPILGVQKPIFFRLRRAQIREIL